MNTFKEKIDSLNVHIEDVYNWVLIFQGKEYRPEVLKEGKVFWDVYENLVFGARVEMYGFGKIYKRVVLAGQNCMLEEIPTERWSQVWDGIYNPINQDASIPLGPVEQNGQLITIAKWWPLDDYVKQLIEKRNFMTTKEFEIWAKLIDDQHKIVGGKTPNYIDPKPFVQVSSRIH